MRKQGWRHGNNMMDLLQHPNAALPIADIVEPPQKGLTGITAKLRNKVRGKMHDTARICYRRRLIVAEYMGHEYQVLYVLNWIVLDVCLVYIYTNVVGETSVLIITHTVLFF